MSKSTEPKQDEFISKFVKTIKDTDDSNVFAPFVSSDVIQFVSKVCETYAADDFSASVLESFHPDMGEDGNAFRMFWTCFDRVSAIQASALQGMRATDIFASCNVSNTHENRQILALFADDAPLPSALARLLEDLSGSVRVIVRFNEHTGGGIDDTRLGIDRPVNAGRVTTFSLDTTLFDADDKAVQHLDAEDGTTRKYQFGPFFNVSTPDTTSNRTFAKNILETDRIVDMLTEQKTNVCLMTYGYSGSGKTYSLFGKLFDDISHYMGAMYYMCLRELLTLTKDQNEHTSDWQEGQRSLGKITHGWLPESELDMEMEESEWESIRSSLRTNSRTPGTFDEMAVHETMKSLKPMFASKIAMVLRGKLYDADGQVSRDAGSLVHVLDALTTKDYIVSLDNVHCLYGYAKNVLQNPPSFNFHVANSPEFKSVDENTTERLGVPGFIVYMMMSMHDMINASSSPEDAFIKSTVNNPQSSRGFLTVRLGIYGRKTKTSLCIIDMAGNEDPFDLMLSMAPLNFIPSDRYSRKVKNYLVDDNIFETNIVFNSLRKTASKLCEVVRKNNITNIKSANDVLSGNAIKEAVKNARTEKAKNEAELKIQNAIMKIFPRHQSSTTPRTIIRGMTDMTSFACYIVVWDFVRGLPFRKKNEGVNKTVSTFVEDPKNDATFNEALSRSLLLSDLPNSTRLIEMSTESLVDEVNKAHTDASKYFKLVNTVIGGKKCIDVQMNCMYFDDICKAFAEDELDVDTDDEQESTGNFYSDLKRALYTKNCDKATELALRNYVDNDDIRIVIKRPEGYQSDADDNNNDYYISLLNVRNDTVTMSYVDNMIKVRFPDERSNTIDDNNAPSLKDMMFVYPKTGTTVSPSVVFRILREAYFINQANLELKALLLQKRIDPNFRKIQFHSTSSCAPAVTELYLENYDTFASQLCDGAPERNVGAKPPINPRSRQSEVTNTPNRTMYEASTLLNTIVNNAEGEGGRCKYILVAAIRKENDDKFRTGAIDTLKLLELLKT